MGHQCRFGPHPPGSGGGLATRVAAPNDDHIETCVHRNFSWEANGF
jgi:hypothetical protein